MGCEPLVVFEFLARGILISASTIPHCWNCSSGPGNKLMVAGLGEGGGGGREGRENSDRVPIDVLTITPLWCPCHVLMWLYYTDGYFPL